MKLLTAIYLASLIFKKRIYRQKNLTQNTADTQKITLTSAAPEENNNNNNNNSIFTQAYLHLFARITAPVVFCPHFYSVRGWHSPCQNPTQVQQCLFASSTHAGIETLGYIWSCNTKFPCLKGSHYKITQCMTAVI
jgi:hypothetical protein